MLKFTTDELELLHFVISEHLKEMDHQIQDYRILREIRKAIRDELKTKNPSYL